MGTFSNVSCDETDDSLSFQHLDKVQKLFQERFQDTLKLTHEYKPKSVEPQVRKEFSAREIEELVSVTKQQQEKQKQLLGEHEQITENLKKVNNTIDELKESFEKLKNELLVTKEEIKRVAKPLAKAIKKYSENLDMNVEVNNYKSENQFVASVRFSSTGDSKPINVLIDRKQRCVVDFDASSVLSDDEALELKRRFADGNNKMDSTILVKTLRERYINNQ